MKSIEHIPLELKLDGKVELKLNGNEKVEVLAAGRYLTAHPFIKHYHISIDVYDEPERERVSIILIKLVSANKKIFRNVDRYPTFDEMMMVRNLFFNEDEEVIQFVQENQEELARGHFFANLIRRKASIACKCTSEEKHGETQIMCCNHCGLPTESFWTNKPL